MTRSWERLTSRAARRTPLALALAFAACTARAADDSARVAASAIPELPQQSEAEWAARRKREPTVQSVRVGDSLRVEVVAEVGAKFNALLPPTIEAADGRRITFHATGITPDSAYFTGPVTVMLSAGALPLRGVLRTSYCLAAERLCRSAQRTVVLE